MMDAEIEELSHLVDMFAKDMKAKLQKKHKEGYRGWDRMDKDTAIAMLTEHIIKGDMVDVGNLALFVWWREKDGG